MSSAGQLDERVVRLSLQINGQLKVYEDLWIESTGCKYANPLQNEAEIKVANLSKADRDYLLTECSPFNKNHTPKLIILEAGRKSSGTTKIFSGNIVSCVPSQPPDITLTFKAQTGNFSKGNIVSTQQPDTTPLSRIAQQVASDNDLSLTFEADDKNISNYAYTGGALKQVDSLGYAGAVDAYVDDGQLIVKNYGTALKGVERVLNAQSGMVGIPEVTEHGVKVTYLLDTQTRLGGALKIESEVYPTLNGRYTIFKLGWNIATREDPFYWIAETLRIGDAGQVVKPNPVAKKAKRKK